MNDPGGEVAQRAEELQLSALLAEVLGVGPGPGLAERTLARVTRSRARQQTRWRGALLAAAVLLVGVGVVLGVATFANRSSPDAPPPPQAAPAGGGSSQDSAADTAAPEARVQDPGPKTDPELARRIHAALALLEIGERRDDGIAQLLEIGNAALPAVHEAIATETARGRGDLVVALHVARAALVGNAAKLAFGLPAKPITLVADYSDNVVVALDDAGKEVWSATEMFGVWDAELTPAGTLLVTEFSLSRVREIGRDGRVLWSFEDLKNPYDADRLPDGNTLICDTFGGRVIEVDHAGKVVWSYVMGIRPFDCDRLADGNTLICDVLNERVVEIDRDGTVRWQQDAVGLVHDADRLANGNTLITLRQKRKVIEVDRAGQVVFELGDLSHPSDADRLPNGHTLVAENGAVREFDRAGKEVRRWDTTTWAVEVGRY